MLGKGALIVVFGFVLAFAVYQLKLSRSVTFTTDNFNSYYIRTLVHEEALSAMNFGINKVWHQNVTADTFNVVANGCTSVVRIFENGLDTVMLKVNSWNYAFVDEYYAQFQKPFKVEDSVFAYFSYSMPISRYFWFTNNEGYVYWITADTVWGPIHTNSVLRTSGSPVFYGKVTAYRGIAPNPTRRGSKAKFYGGWEVGIYNEIPTDMTPLINAATAGNGSAPINTKCIYDKPTSFEFLSDGNVIRVVDSDPPDTVLLTDIAPTGVIYSTKDVRVKGVLNGQLTIYSTDDIWIDDDIIYANDPNADPNSDDILGLIANDKVIVTDNEPNNNDINIQACVMAVNSYFTAQNYGGRPIAGVLRLTGSIVQNRRGGVGTFSRWTNSITHGFSKRYRFDSRLALLSAPYYPYVRNLHLVSWWE